MATIQLRSDINIAVTRLVAILISSASLLTAAGAVAQGVDSWEPVAIGGLGDSSRVTPHALTIFDSHVWVATVELLGGGMTGPVLFRAPLSNDTLWVDVTPPWTVEGEITDLEPFGSYLYVSTTAGELWRFDGTSGTPWQIVATGWLGNGAVYDLTSWTFGFIPEMLCAVRVGVVDAIEVWCGLDLGIIGQFRLPVPLNDTSDIGSAVIAGFTGAIDALYVGVSGTTAGPGTRPCEVLFMWDLLIWSQVTVDCFGDTDLPWVFGMVEFGGDLYIPTGGHFGEPKIVHTRPFFGWTDVTPTSLFPCDALGFGRCVARYGALATTSEYLFAGTRTAFFPAGIADVARTDGATWENSNDPGFGMPDNDTTTALAGDGIRMYAAVLNTVTGFEVWRRNGLLPASAALVADYQFRDSLASSVAGAPDLVPLGGGGSFQTVIVNGDKAVRGYVFPPATGLDLDVTGLFASNDVYTAVLLFQVEEVIDWVRLIDTKDRVINEGIYFQDFDLDFYDETEGTGDILVSGVYYQVVVTRDGADAYTGYVDGVEQLTFSDAANSYGSISGDDRMVFFRDDLETDDMVFFRDDLETDDEENSSGAVVRIRLYDKALNSSEVAALDRLAGGQDFNIAIPTLGPAGLVLVVLAIGALALVTRRRQTG